MTGEETPEAAEGREATERKASGSAPGHRGNLAAPFCAAAPLSDLGQVTPHAPPRIGLPLRGLRGPRAASRRPPAQGRGALQAESTARSTAAAGRATLGAPSPGDRSPSAAARACPRGARPEVTQPAGPLTRACTVPMAPSPTAASQSCQGPAQAHG